VDENFREGGLKGELKDIIEEVWGFEENKVKRIDEDVL
jgi:hypothetical protein